MMAKMKFRLEERHRAWHLLYNIHCRKKEEKETDKYYGSVTTPDSFRLRLDFRRSFKSDLRVGVRGAGSFHEQRLVNRAHYRLRPSLKS